MIKWGQIILVFSKWTWLVTRDRDRIPLDSPNGSALNSCPSPRLLLNFRTSLLVSTRAYGEARLRSSVWGKICRKPWIFTAFTYFLRAFHRFWPPKSPKIGVPWGSCSFFPSTKGLMIGLEKNETSSSSSQHSLPISIVHFQPAWLVQ